jgi:hypothetical protein
MPGRFRNGDPHEVQIHAVAGDDTMLTQLHKAPA